MQRITYVLRKKAILLHYAGEKVFDLAESLGIIEETTLKYTKRILTDEFAPQRNVEYEVFTFQAAQLSMKRWIHYMPG